MALFGLQNSEALDAYRFKSLRRSVFYDYPNGAFPLAGLLSLLEEESCSDPRFEWWEKRDVAARTVAANISTTVVFGDATSPYAALSANFTPTLGSSQSVCIADTTIFSVGNTIRMQTTNTSAALQYIYGLVTAVIDSSTAADRRIVVKWVRTAAVAVDYDAAGNAGLEVLITGYAAAEGSLSQSRGVNTLPINPFNYTQIFRRKFSITGTQLKTALKYDETGQYKDLAKDNLIRIMQELDWSFLFGQRAKTTSAVNGLPEYMSGGIVWALEQWEAANSDYRGGTGAPAVTGDTNDDKRIIDNTSGTVSESFWDDLLERAFRSTNTKSNEKLGVCGSGFLNAFSKYLKKNVTANVETTVMDGPYGMSFVKYVTPFGTLCLKTHPRWNQIPQLRNSVLIVDVPELKYRYLDGRDMYLRPNIQPNDADYREDEFFADCGLEMNFPERFMMIHNVNQFVP